MKVRYRWYHLLWLLLGFLCLAAVTIYVILVYGKINTEIPTHFNFQGAADAYGNKSSLIVLLAVGWLLYLLLTVVGAFPRLWNTGVAVTDENRERVYAILRTMSSLLTFLIPAFFSFVILCATRGEALPVLALPVFLGLVFGTVLISVLRLMKKR